MRMFDVMGRILSSVYAIKLKTTFNWSATNQKKLPSVKSSDELPEQSKDQLYEYFLVFHPMEELFSLELKYK